MLTMKAVRIHEYGGPEVLKYEENVPRPEPGPGELLIRVCACGVNPLDWKVREGYMKRPLPLILGWDLAGYVVGKGPSATVLSEGDEVYGRPDTSRQGAYAEFIVVRQQEVAEKPKSLDFINSAAIPLAGLTAWQSLFDIADLDEGQTILIHGAAGGVGHYAVQFARWKRAKVIGTATGDDVEFVRSLGADEVIDYKKTKFEDVVHDVDVVLDVLGGETQERSWQVLKKGGILVSTLGIQSPDAPAKYGVRGEGVVATPDAAELGEIAQLVDDGYVRPHVQMVLPLNEAAKAHEMLQKGQVHGKIVLRIE